jgi:putative transcriptional regulator
VLDWRDHGWRTTPFFESWSRLKTARFYAGLSQDELAAAVGASRGTISSLERRRSTPSLTLAVALAQELSVTVEELFPAGDLR